MKKGDFFFSIIIIVITGLMSLLSFSFLTVSNLQTFLST